MKEIYFDNSSTTQPSPGVIDLVVRTMREDFGNPSSLHRKGVDAEHYVRDAREKIAATLRAKPEEIFFTSGGTEADNWAVIGTALAARRRGKRIVTTAMEHPAVAEPVRFLEKMGFETVVVPVDASGMLDPDTLREALTEDTILVSTMYVNNEIGSVVPVGEIARAVREKAPEALYHVDAIQAYGKFRICPSRLGIDLLSVSGHKFHGPKGTGFLYVRSGARILPILYGGGQQKGMRSGTDNVPGIAGMGEAAAEAYRDFEKKTEHLVSLRDRLEAGLRELDGIVIHGEAARERAPHIVNAAFTGVGAEVLLHSLEDRGIYVSAGSACSMHRKKASATLTAIGAPAGELTSSIRFSFCETNTAEEVDTALQAVRELLPALRRYRAH